MIDDRYIGDGPHSPNQDYPLEDADESKKVFCEDKQEMLSKDLLIEIKGHYFSYNFFNLLNATRTMLAISITNLWELIDEFEAEGDIDLGDIETKVMRVKAEASRINDLFKELIYKSRR